jgi:cold shock CspA family protein
VVVSFSGTYGWLRPSGADKDVFFHQSGIKAAPGAFRAVVPGQVVTFEITHGPKGPVAIGLEIEIKSQVLHNYPGVKY